VHAVRWAKLAWAPVVVGMGLISIATPLVSTTVRERWFSMPEFIALLPIPLMTVLALLGARAMLNSHRVLGKVCWLPFVLVIAVFVLGFFGLAYSLYPYVVIDRLTLWQAASSPAALKVILVGTCISVPAIAAYTVFSYKVFGGKTTELRYA
jgi:cytochrome d ubiquinol oxidase subunit II